MFNGGFKLQTVFISATPLNVKYMAENKIILSKESSESEIKAYFNAVLKLSQDDNEFPINFDEVWMLVYEDKRSAVYELKDKFIQGVDFQTVRKKAQASNVAGFVWADEYQLTLSCMEFFIARKVRPVFEVYRKVFHHSVNEKVNQLKSEPRKKTLTDQMKAATWAAKFLNLSDSSKLLMAKKILDPLGLPTPDYTPSKGIKKSATDLLKERGLYQEIKPREFNLKAIEHGYLCTMERSSTHGQVKTFKCITEKGLKYGENDVSPYNSNEVQPNWYEESFNELLCLVGFEAILKAHRLID